LFQALSSDFLLREQFITDPAGILSEYVDGKSLPSEAATAANQLLYAVVSNPAMLRWLRQESNAVRNGSISNRFLAANFAAAVTRHGDEAVIASLIRCGANGSGTVVPALDLVKAAVTLAGGPQRQSGGTEFTPVRPGTEVSPGTGTEFTPGTGGGTESTPARPGTEFTPVRPGTEVSPGTGTEFTPGTGGGTESTPARPGTEFTPVRPGTEVSPGTGTEFTPGTGGGTESTPAGNRPGPASWGEFEVVLGPLVAYASELRAVGTLTETGLE
jgi:hypothetical protein